MSVAKIEVNGKIYEAPITIGSEGEIGIDISKFRSQTGSITLDGGFKNTGACTSDITFVDGANGVLRYRGYAIEELCDKSNFLEVSNLLVNGELPSSSSLNAFADKIEEASALPEGIHNIIKSFPKSAHPMGVLSSALCGLSGFFPEKDYGSLTQADYDELIPKMMGYIKMIAAANYRHNQGLEIGKSDSSLSYCSDFINLMFGKIDDDVAEALDVLFILHADHEQNCSATAARVAGSAQANIFASMSSGVNALWGPRHGGANQKVIEMLEMIEKNGGDYKKFIEKAKDKSDPFRLMGFGHRVYKNFDPRAKIIKVYCETVLNKLGVKDATLDIAKGLEEEALKDPYFVERKLYPNVDFYSGIIYRALGIPTNMFTVMFAIGRLPGWMAQWKELLTQNMAISRPRQIYTGKNLRSYTSIESR